MMMHRSWRFAVFAMVMTFLLALARPALALEPASDPEALFAEGSALMEQGKYEEALPKLERAQKADPGIGTLFNIAVCHQKLGHLGSAYRSFREVMQLARASGKKAREDAAKAKVDEVKGQAPAFAIRVQEKGDVTVRVDGAALTKEDWTYYPVDPGDHQIEAIAGSKKPWSKKAPTPAAGKVEEITVPALEVAKDVVTVTTTDKRRTLAYVFGGVGVAGVITATVTGILLLGDASTAKEHCQGDLKVCRLPNGEQDPEGADAVSRGKTLIPINAIAWGVAAVGLGVGTFFFLTSGKKTPEKSAKRSPSLVPNVDVSAHGMSGATATLVGTF